VQIKKQKLWCEENHIAYTVRSEREIYAGEYFIENCSYMASKVRRYVLPKDIGSYRDVLIGYLEACGKAEIGKLIETGRLPLGNEINFLCYMHFVGVIRMGIMDLPLDNRTEVALIGR